MARKAKVVAPVISEDDSELVEQVTVIDGEVVTVEEPTTRPSVLSQLISTPEVKAEVKAEKNEGVGQFIRKLIGEGLSNKAILAIVHEQYDNKNTTYACVAWYRNKMKKTGETQKVVVNLDWVQNFAKANNLSEEGVAELSQAMKVA